MLYGYVMGWIPLHDAMLSRSPKTMEACYVVSIAKIGVQCCRTNVECTGLPGRECIGVDLQRSGKGIQALAPKRSQDGPQL